MKITNLRRSIAAALLAAGIWLPSWVSAAPLDTNLIINPSFENVDVTTTVGGYGALLILDWMGGGGAYDYSQLYDNGGPLAGGGNKYFTPNAVAEPGCDMMGTELCGPITQDIDISTGDSGAVIAANRGRYDLSAFFSSYSTDGDLGAALVEFLDAGMSVLGSGSVQDSDPTNWAPRDSVSGSIPVGTTTARITLHGIPMTFGPDGYIDLVDFRVLQGPPGVTGDFNNDGMWNCADINALTAEIAASGTNLAFDMNGDGQISLADVTAPASGWLAVGGANNPTQTNGNPFRNGDANLNGVVDGSDFGIWNSNKFTMTTAWCNGNFNGDNVADGSDFGIWNANKFTSSAQVPEPVSTVLVLWGTVMALGIRGVVRRD